MHQHKKRLQPQHLIARSLAHPLKMPPTRATNKTHDRRKRREMTKVLLHDHKKGGILITRYPLKENPKGKIVCGDTRVKMGKAVRPEYADANGD